MTWLSTDWLDWSGRTSRKQFAIFIGAFAIVLSVVFVVTQDNPPFSGAKIFAFVMMALLLFPRAGFTVRRLHDTGRSGAWTVVSFIPGIGIVVILWLLFARQVDVPYQATNSGMSRLGLLALCVLALALCSRVFWAPFWIPSGSMKPTLLVGDFLTVSRGNGSIQHGDVIVFRHPVGKFDFLKRVVGVPGDTVQMVDGLPVINGTAVVQTPTDPFVEVFEQQGPSGLFPRCAGGQVGLGQECVKDQSLETLPNEISYKVLNIMDTQLDNTAVYTVPDWHVFVLGDNRDNSTDSRVDPLAGGVGFVPIANIHGRAQRILFSSAGRHLAYFWTWRPGRYLKAVK